VPGKLTALPCSILSSLEVYKKQEFSVASPVNFGHVCINTLPRYQACRLALQSFSSPWSFLRIVKDNRGVLHNVPYKAWLTILAFFLFLFIIKYITVKGTIVSLLSLLGASFVMGLSGAMMPGPMLAADIEGSLRKGFWAGPAVVGGHVLLEVLLLGLLFVGFKDVLLNPWVGGFIGLLGGAYLAWMGYGMIRSAVRGEISLDSTHTGGSGKRTGTFLGLAAAGFLLSASNPYFLIWWATVGLSSLSLTQGLGLMGVAVFYTGHGMADMLWYGAVSAGMATGRRWLNDGVYRVIIAVLGVFMAGFSLYFIVSGGLGLWRLLA
jgi:threonine/homoserine/homoserine lactone efflux protein